MFRRFKTKAGAAFAVLAPILVLLLAAPVARAADPVYPPGSRVGLVPPDGMMPSHNFQGFEDPDNKALIYITALPAAAYPELEKSPASEMLAKEGITVEKREPLDLAAGKGFLIIGTLTADNVPYRKWLAVLQTNELTALIAVQRPEQSQAYPDQVVRAALASVTVRPHVPEAEQLSMLPFTVGDLSGFHIASVLPGRALMLVDQPVTAEAAAAKPDAPKDAAAAAQKFNGRLFVAAVPGGPSQSDDRSHFARLAFDDIGGIKNVQITMSEPLRIGGDPGFQTMAQAKAALNDLDIMVVQWLRFGSGGFFQMVGVSRTDDWPEMLARMRAVRDSIQPK